MFSERVPYIDVKTQFKHALSLTTAGTSHHLLQLRAILLHNLAVVNYCELSDHNDRVLSGGSDHDDEAMLTEIEKAERLKAQAKREQVKVSLELEK